MSHGKPIVTTIAGPQELAELQAVAAEDRHVVIGATHVARKDGRIVGYASVGGILLLNCWADSRRLRPRESFELLWIVERIAAERGAKEVCLPCSPASPFLPFIGKLGYARLGEATYNIKALKGAGR